MGTVVLGRAGSAPAQFKLDLGSPMVPENITPAGYFLSRRRSSSSLSPGSLYIEDKDVPQTFRRAKSEAIIVGSAVTNPQTLPEKIAEEEEEPLGKCRLLLSLGISAETEADPLSQVQEVEFSGGGKGKGRKIGGGRGHGDEDRSGDLSGMRSYYQELLKAHPGNPLLLRNYGQFLHEVEGDAERAEECYGRALLASPGNGEVLSMYGRLIWETERDGVRAGDYFERAIEAAPGDCYVLGSYASFLWDAEEEEEEREQVSSSSSSSFPRHHHYIIGPR